MDLKVEAVKKSAAEMFFEVQRAGLKSVIKARSNDELCLKATALFKVKPNKINLQFVEPDSGDKLLLANADAFELMEQRI